MHHLIKARLQDMLLAASKGTPYGAVALALTLPDLCADVEGRKQGRDRYIKWAEEFVIPLYTTPAKTVGSPLMPTTIPERVALTGKDLYQLRCAVLHAGSDVADKKDVLSRFIFVVSGPVCIHCNTVGTADGGRALQLDVLSFCETMQQAVAAWDERVTANGTSIRVDQLMEIHDLSDGRPFSTLGGRGIRE